MVGLPNRPTLLLTTSTSVSNAQVTSAAPPGTLRCETLFDLSEVPADVEALFQHSERADPEFGLAWFRNLAASVYPRDAGVCVHVLRINQVAAAALPLHVSTGRWGRVAKGLGNFYTCLYAPALADGLKAEQLAALFKDVLRVHAPLATLSLAPLDGDSAAFALMHQALRIAGLRTFSHNAFGNWYLPVTSSYDEYMVSRPGEVRSTLKRMGKKFMAAGGRFEIVDSPAQAAQAIAAYVAVYNTSWKRPEPYEAFMPGLAQLCADKGWLRLGLAWIGERPVAAQFWIVSGGKAYIYKLAYDAEFRQLSPGSQLTALLMRRSMDEDKVVEIDYMKGDDAYKNQWMTHRRERMALMAFNPLTLGGLWGWARESAARALVALKLRTPKPGGSQTAEQG